jgi:hypothetical protein
MREAKPRLRGGIAGAGASWLFIGYPESARMTLLNAAAAGTPEVTIGGHGHGTQSSACSEHSRQ